MIAKRVAGVFKAGGAMAVARAILRRLRTPHARSYAACRAVVEGGVGMEIGGPTSMFARGGLLPLYPAARRVDNCNFARTTEWEGTIAEGDSFVFDARKAPGTQYIAEGADLHMIASEQYDFFLSSHMLEHTANPLRALQEWSRLLKQGGHLVLVVPHRDGTFDHRRPVTTMAHLQEDLERGTQEDDLTHLDEVLALHDVSKDPGAHAITLRERMERNAELRNLHHHVFDSRLAADVVEHAGLEILALEPLEPYHVVVLARRPVHGTAPRPLSAARLQAALRGSPFVTDRLPR
ncbi:MAG: methyltransferase [Gemmatimonadetes bacterium]|nr:methyltransferase [Gemmatimonadota bacterium]